MGRWGIMIEQQSHLLYFWDLREQVLPLPSITNGYPRVLFVGTTGVGKTTLVREFLGVNPLERFPASSGGKTTTADLEFILTQGSYKAVVTFHPQEKIVNWIQDCLLAAAQTHYESQLLNKVGEKFLEHAEQRFRLKYILGAFLGIRTSGPFQPMWRPTPAPRLVLIDGEGLGHAMETVTSIPTRITDLLERVDAIVLVDHAKSPMQAMAQTVLETVVASGHASKLFVSFTHFDEVQGDNFADREAREEHVQNSFDQMLLKIGNQLGQRNRQLLRKSLEGRVFFLSLPTIAQEDRVPPEATETQDELRRMLAAIEAIEIPTPPDGLQPTYNENELFSFIRKVIENFRARWKALMAIGTFRGVSPEHWSRIKALSRRVGERGEEEYDYLKPVADLMKETTEQVRKFLEERPVRWTPSDYGSEEMRQAAIDAIFREFHQRLHGYIRSRMIVTPRADWMTALNRAGPGSAKVRAYDINRIYRTVVPTRDEIVQNIDLESLSTSEIGIQWKDDEFTIEITAFVREAIEAKGGKFIH
jgi:hypothetical protein